MLNVISFRPALLRQWVGQSFGFGKPMSIGKPAVLPIKAQGKTELLIVEKLALEFAFGRYSRSRHRGSARSIKSTFGFV
jgi:hypothetical protein